VRPKQLKVCRVGQGRHEELQLVQQVLAVHLLEPEFLKSFRQVFPLLVFDYGTGEEIFGRRRSDVNPRLSRRRLRRGARSHGDIPEKSLADRVSLEVERARF